MPYEFTPDERMQNILVAIEFMQKCMHDAGADNEQRLIFRLNLESLMVQLNDCLNDMKPQPVTYEVTMPAQPKESADE